MPLDTFQEHFDARLAKKVSETGLPKTFQTAKRRPTSYANRSVPGQQGADTNIGTSDLFCASVVNWPNPQMFFSSNDVQSVLR